MTFVQGGANDSGPIVPSLAVTLAATVGIRHTVAVFISYLTTASEVATVTDDKSNTYTPVDSIAGAGAATFTFASYYLTNITNAPKTITVSFSINVNFVTLVVIEETATGALFGHSINQQPALAPGTDAATSGSVSNAPRNCTVIGGSANGGADSVPSAGTGFTIRVMSVDLGQNEYSFVEDLTTSSSGNVAATFTPTGTDDWACAVLVFWPPGPLDNSAICCTVSP